MRTLIVEDEFTSRKILQKILSPFGECDIAINGEEAVKAFKLSWDEEKPYNLICMDIMMPKLDGKEALKMIRNIEREKGIVGSQEVKVIMTTALGDPKNVIESLYKGGATSYIVKPITKQKIMDEMASLGVI